LIAKNKCQGLKNQSERSVDQSFAEIKINLISASHLFMVTRNVRQLHVWYVLLVYGCSSRTETSSKRL